MRTAVRRPEAERGLRGFECSPHKARNVRGETEASRACRVRLASVSRFQDRPQHRININFRRVGLRGPGKLTADVLIKGRELWILTARHLGRPPWDVIPDAMRLPTTSSPSGSRARA